MGLQTLSDIRAASMPGARQLKRPAVHPPAVILVYHAGEGFAGAFLKKPPRQTRRGGDVTFRQRNV